MDATIVSALTRHILTAVGGSLLAQWGLSGDQVEAVAGAVAVVAGVAWSLYEKKSREKGPE